MSLKKYIHQVKPREESYVNHVNRIQQLMESKIDATKFEGDLLIAMGAHPTEVGSYNGTDDAKSLASDIIKKIIL